MRLPFMHLAVLLCLTFSPVALGRSKFFDSIDVPATQLVTIDTKDNKTLLPNRQGLDLLRDIKGKVLIISCVGAYRSGKSFLLNRLMNMHTPYTGGFGVDNTTAPVTHGLWIKPEVLQGTDTTIIWMDTEGLFGSVGGRYNHKLFSFSMLFSSLMIVNNDRTYKDWVFQFFREQEAFSRLVKHELDEHSYGGLLRFPQWVFWNLNMFDLEGEPDKELENFLADVPNDPPSQAVTDENALRKNIRTNFDNIAWAIPPATDSSSLWKKLKWVKDKTLTKEFLKHSQGLRKSIMDRATIVNAETLFSGKSLQSLIIPAFTTLINTDKFDNNPLDRYIESVKNQSCQTYTEAMDEARAGFPMSLASLRSRHIQADITAQKGMAEALSSVGLPPSTLLDKLHHCEDGIYKEAQNYNLLKIQDSFQHALVQISEGDCENLKIIDQVVDNFTRNFPEMGPHMLKDNATMKFISYKRSNILTSCYKLSAIFMSIFPFLIPLFAFSVYFLGAVPNIIAIGVVAGSYLYCDHKGYIKEIDEWIAERMDPESIFADTAWTDLMVTFIITALYIPVVIGCIVRYRRHGYRGFLSKEFRQRNALEVSMRQVARDTADSAGGPQLEAILALLKERESNTRGTEKLALLEARLEAMVRDMRPPSQAGSYQSISARDEEARGGGSDGADHDMAPQSTGSCSSLVSPV